MPAMWCLSMWCLSRVGHHILLAGDDSPRYCWDRPYWKDRKDLDRNDRIVSEAFVDPSDRSDTSDPKTPAMWCLSPHSSVSEAFVDPSDRSDTSDPKTLRG
jgi:hypothetical protein